MYNMFVTTKLFIWRVLSSSFFPNHFAELKNSIEKCNRVAVSPYLMMQVSHVMFETNVVRRTIAKQPPKTFWTLAMFSRFLDVNDLPSRFWSPRIIAYSSSDFFFYWLYWKISSNFSWNSRLTWSRLLTAWMYSSIIKIRCFLV